MLAELPEGVDINTLPMVDIGRPSFFKEWQAEIWKKLHDWVVETDTPIYVSGAFHVVKRFLDEGQMYGGNGFRYCFWFNNEEDKATFVAFSEENDREWNERMAKERLAKEYTSG